MTDRTRPCSKVLAIPEDFDRMGCEEIARIALGDLPQLHKDPFDRILVAQARVEGLLLLTADKLVAKYGEGVRKI